MKKIIQFSLSIQPGEETRVLYFIRLSFFWAFATTCIETLADGLFLKNVGSLTLPKFYLYSSLGTIGISSFILYALKTANSFKILKTVMLLGSFLSLVSIVLLSIYPPPWFWLALKIFSRMFFSIFLASAWTFIDQYHDSNQAKRIYSLYSSAYFLGIVTSGTAINLLLELLGYPSLFLLAFFFILFSLREATKIQLYIPKKEIDIPASFSISGSLVKSPFTLFLITLSLLIQFMLTVTECNYLSGFERSIHTFTAEYLSEFLGKCRAWISFANIVISAFFYRPLLNRFGIKNVILITPIFFLIVYSGWIVHDSLFFAILGLIAVDSILFTFEDNSFNLLTKEVPDGLRARVRIINDAFFEPIGMLVGASFLLGIQKHGLYLGFIFSFIALGICLILRTSYTQVNSKIESSIG